jgi:hypothetical protein
MSGRIEHHAYVALWLVGRQFGSDGNCVRNRRVDVVDLQVKVHRHLWHARHSRPHRPDVLRLSRERKVVASILRWSEVGPSVGFVEDGPAEEPSVEVCQLAGTRCVEDDTPPLALGSQRHLASYQPGWPR